MARKPSNWIDKRGPVPDTVRNERETRLLMGDAEHTEYLRRVRVAEDQSPMGQGDSPIYQEEIRRRRYSQGGLQDRLRGAAFKRALVTAQWGRYPQSEAMYRCFIGRG